MAVPFARDRQFWRLVLSAAIVGTLAACSAFAFTMFVKWGTDLIWPEDINYDFGGGEVWWLAVTTASGVVVGVSRRLLRVPDQPSGALTMIQDAHTDHRTALQTITVSAVSLIGGSSLGPFDAGVRSGGAVGQVFSSFRHRSEEEREINTTSGIAGSLGGLLTAPFLATLLVTELRKPPPERYYRVLIPNLTGALFGFFVYFSVVGDTFLGVFSVPGYDVRPWHFGLAAVLGVVAAAVSWILGITVAITRRIASRYISNSVVRAAAGGLIVGVIAIALPLTLASGKEQLSFATDNIGQLSAELLILVVFGKILAMSVSLATGFIGGPVMPTLFIGGTTGVAIHLLVPELPLALTFSCMLVAVPGTSIRAPFTMLLLALLTVGVGPADGAPAGVAVVVAYLVTSGLGLFSISANVSVDPDENDKIVFRDELFDIGDPSPGALDR